MQNEYKKFKIIIIGEGLVGKTCILLRYTDKPFRENTLATIGIDSITKSVDYNGMNVKLNIWDTTGQERYNNLTKSFIKGAQGIIVVYDISDRNSFLKVQNWLNYIINSGEKDVSVLLVGNKSDLNTREVTYEEGEELARNNNFLFIEMSAKTNKNIKEGFEILLKNLCKNVSTDKTEESITLYSAKNDKKTQNRYCCN